MNTRTHIAALSLLLSALTACDNNGYGPEWEPSLTPHHLHISTMSLSYDAHANLSQTFSVESMGTPWQFSGMPSWLSVSPATGNSTATVTITATENPSTTEGRTAVITFASTDAGFDFRREITVTQAADYPYITISQTNLSFSAAPATQKIDVTANCDWTASCSETWVTLTTSADKKSLSVAVSENLSTTSSRHATISLSYDGNVIASLSVTQIPLGALTFTVSGNGLTNITFNMLLVEPGTFQMGSTGSDEKPIHSVTLTKAYYMGQTEVTQALWQAVMGYKPTNGDSQWSSSYGLGDNYPAYYISYTDCQEFITKLNAMTGQKFRMPTEAEWEFAARGGTKSKGYTYAGSNTIGDVAWYADNLDIHTHPVGEKQDNELGLYDMSGNVWEWCADWYGSYTSGAQTNPTGPTTGSDRVCRGGSWYYEATACHVASRLSSSPGDRYNFAGFRLAL